MANNDSAGRLLAIRVMIMTMIRIRTTACFQTDARKARHPRGVTPGAEITTPRYAMVTSWSTASKEGQRHLAARPICPGSAIWASRARFPKG